MEKTRILIVDDEPSVGDALRLVLESSGYEVVLVTKGLDGIDQARAKPFGFSVVDLYLTDISGFQVISNSSHHCARPPEFFRRSKTTRRRRRTSQAIPSR
jgi:DNA-binding response OmpR family regulator